MRLPGSSWFLIFTNKSHTVEGVCGTGPGLHRPSRPCRPVTGRVTTSPPWCRACACFCVLVSFSVKGEACSWPFCLFFSLVSEADSHMLRTLCSFPARDPCLAPPVSLGLQEFWIRRLS